MINNKVKKVLLRRIEGESATPFERKVWKVLLTIPSGEVRSYSWIAKRVGSPHAARAVGNALKKNRFAPAVPCHRVVKKDGTLGGYSGPGGPRKKRGLLKQEGVL